MEKIQELTDKLYREGVEKGNAEGQKLVEQAKSEAAKIVEEAHAQAEKIVAEAQKKANDLENNTKAKSHFEKAYKMGVPQAEGAIA